MAKEKALEIRAAYCSDCDQEKEFKLQGTGIALINIYVCRGCGKIVCESYLDKKKQNSLDEEL